MISYVCLLFSLCVHEAAHAAMANYCGDPSARLMGRLTLNPLAHIDPLGTVVMPLLMMFTGIPLLFGWAKPVPFNPRNLKDIRRDPVLIAVAGPGSNLLLALFFLLLTRGLVMVLGLETLPDLLVLFFVYMLMINLVLAIFNLIPVPPLDGHHVLYYFLPPGGQRVMEQIGPYGILIAILMARPLFGVFHPVIGTLQNFALGF